ncbi:hypothetical protein [Helicobacter sp. MIT 01-3238]|uniref:hypothetical protein n=1 Tax=Helicobacter sp. MIT 01-3238 TaxID=398627 RepID=UPI0015F12ECA|nr:hypothetical protein [Helicobacter sp. MIT 01-3238]
MQKILNLPPYHTQTHNPKYLKSFVIARKSAMIFAIINKNNHHCEHLEYYIPNA